MDAKDFVPIRVSTLRGDLKIPFDAYIRIAEKFILYCRQGDSFEGERLSRLREKRLKKMFILQEHEKHYRSYLNDNIDSAYDPSSTKSIETRAQVVQGSQQAAAEDVMDTPEDEELYSIAKTGSSHFVDFLLNNNHAIKAVMSIKNSNGNIGHHGVNVATLAIGMADQDPALKENSTKINLLTLGCLLHDIEHQHNNLNVARPFTEMSASDKALYKQHPLNGAARAQDKKHFDQMVIKIIAQHEEKDDGSGFPQGLVGVKMDPLVMIASLANAYDRIVSFEGKSRKDALKHLLVYQVGAYPLAMLHSLQKTLKSEDILDL